MNWTGLSCIMPLNYVFFLSIDAKKPQQKMIVWSPLVDTGFSFSIVFPCNTFYLTATVSTIFNFKLPISKTFNENVFIHELLIKLSQNVSINWALINHNPSKDTKTTGDRTEHNTDRTPQPNPSAGGGNNHENKPKLFHVFLLS